MNDKAAFDRVNAAIAGFVFLATFVVYYLTKAPTFSFWDCGEFVACSYILGIPHPPGSPLYIIIGRVFSVLPIAADIAVRINLFSVITSAVAACFGYLVTVRLIRFWFDTEKHVQNRIVAYIGGFTGALFMAFGNSMWSNSVEAEVYAPTIMTMLIMYWLGLKYLDDRETPRGSRFMLLVAFLAMLGVGMHLTLFAIVPVVALCFLLKKESGGSQWGTLSFFFLAELYFIFQFSSRPGEIPFYIPLLIVFIIMLFHSVLINRLDRPVTATLVLFLVSLYPLYFVIADAAARNLTGSELSEGFRSLGSAPVGWIGLAGLAVWGLYSLVRYFSEKERAESDKSRLMIGIYSLAPVLLVLVSVLSIRGYAAFLISSLMLTGVLALTMWRYVNWLILIAFGAISMVILGFWPFVWGLGIGTAAIIILGLLARDGSWKTAVAIILLAVVGYSIHAFIPIRSAHNPTIDENDPDRSFAAVVGYLERKQYGTQSMTERMFERRAEWANQFGDFERMGFWRFFKQQYGFAGPRFFIMLILGLFGIWEAIRRKPDIGLPFWVIVLVCSVGIVLYMNFADGTRQHPVTGADYIEVRDRDYFFTPAFVFFGLAIGLGIAGFIDLIRDTVSGFSRGVRNLAFGASTLLVFLPVVPLSVNYFYNDQSKNYMPYDYAENYHKSCRENAIFITNGDNDTFPIWCIQEVYGVRKDVKVVNLSLGNTDWYIRQVRDELGIPLKLSDEQILKLRPYRDEEGGVHRIQDQLVDNIITANRWKDPIHFAVTVPEENRRFGGRSMEDHLVIEGMVHYLSPEKKEHEINFERTRELYAEAFAYRGVSDPDIYKDETSTRLTNNYAQGFLLLADSLRKAQDYEGALEYVKMGLEILPNSFDTYGYATQLLAQAGRMDTMRTLIENSPVEDKARLYFNWGIAARAAGRNDDAIEALELTHQMYPDYVDAFRALATTYYRMKQYKRLREIVTVWVTRHPEDYESVELLRQIEQIEPTRDTLEGIN
ncbi:MAG: DUF2723 domain-containing protein [Candidatus Zixiibacteriota bacterium]|nr:MAG: DUF2723 domain-containing protein [candidate division Zixibacteria bacterium]